MNWQGLSKSNEPCKVGPDHWCRLHRQRWLATQICGGLIKGLWEQAITLAVWTQMKAVGVSHGDSALCKELAAQVSRMKAGELTRYLGKA